MGGRAINSATGTLPLATPHPFFELLLLGCTCISRCTGRPAPRGGLDAAQWCLRPWTSVGVARACA